MKKILFVVSVLLLTSCNTNILMDDIVREVPDKFYSSTEAWFWVSDNITYKADLFFGLTDQWQTPEETLELRTGDCEDFCILLMYFLHEMDIPSQFIGYGRTNFKHAILMVNEKYIEPQIGGFYYSPVDIVCPEVIASSYEDILQLANKKGL